MLDDLIPDAVQFGTATGVSLGVVLAMVRWAATFLASRHDAREAHLDASHDKLIVALEAQITSLSDRFEKAVKRIDTVEEELLECKRMHAESEADRMRLGALLQGMGDARQHAQLIIADEKRKEGKA